MTLEQQIESILRSEYDSGKTQQEMAESLHISQQYIQQLLSGQRKVSGLTLKILMKMFPRATLHLHGDVVTADNSGVNNGVMGINNGTVNTTGTESAEAFRDRALKVLMDLDIPPDALLKVLKTLKDLPI